MAVTPIFVFAISRTGSTLLQRILAAHESVASQSEPFLLLPLLRPLQERTLGGGEWHSLEHQGLTDLTSELPDGVSRYEREVRDLTLNLYEAAAAGKPYFLDKTPPYYAVVEEIIRTFPEGKFVFLWRSPLAVIASCVETWAAGQWRVERFRRDWFDGLPTLIESYERHRDRAFSIRYEDVAGGDLDRLEALFAYVGLPWDPSVVARFAQVDLRGRLGDPTGIQRYGSLSREPLEKWQRTLASPVRRWWCDRYLRWLGRERLAVAGFDLDKLTADLHEVPVDYGPAAGDMMNLGRLAVREMFTTRVRDRPPASWRRLLSTPRA